MLLVGVMIVVAIVLTLALRSILLDEAKAKVDRTGVDIARLVTSSGALGALGDALPIQAELILPGNLEHWSSPTTYVEIDRGDGYPQGKSSNMGDAIFAPSPFPRNAPVTYAIESSPLGSVFVRDELIALPGNGAMIVKVGERLDIYDVTLQRIRELLAAIVAVAAIAIVGASILLASSAIKPIEELGDAMREIGSERLDRRLKWSTRADELGKLAETFDAMLARLEEAFARERQFISDASHELKTPLTIINANAQLLERWGDKDPDVRRDSLHAIGTESAALARLVNGMLMLARAESGDGIPRERLDLNAVITEALEFSRSRAAEKGLALRFSRATPDPLVFGDANLLRQLFSNLIENAIKFTEEGTVEVSASVRAGEAVVDVADTGIGIEEDALERVFDRFYRTDKSRSRLVEGTGLGLAIVRSIARVHGGRVEATRNAAGGTTMRVVLPSLISPS